MSELYRILIVLRQPQSNIVLMFTSEQAAKDALAVTQPSNEPALAAVTDNYGNSARIDLRAVCASIFTDITRDLELQVEMSLKQARAQQKAQKRAAADPDLGGKQIVTPGGGVIGFPGNRN